MLRGGGRSGACHGMRWVRRGLTGARHPDEWRDAGRGASGGVGIVARRFGACGGAGRASGAPGGRAGPSRERTFQGVPLSYPAELYLTVPSCSYTRPISKQMALRQEFRSPSLWAFLCCSVAIRICIKRRSTQTCQEVPPRYQTYDSSKYSLLSSYCTVRP